MIASPLKGWTLHLCTNTSLQGVMKTSNLMCMAFWNIQVKILFHCIDKFSAWIWLQQIFAYELLLERNIAWDFTVLYFHHIKNNMWNLKMMFNFTGTSLTIVYHSHHFQADISAKKSEWMIISINMLLLKFIATVWLQQLQSESYSSSRMLHHAKFDRFLWTVGTYQSSNSISHLERQHI